MVEGDRGAGSWEKTGWVWEEGKEGVGSRIPKVAGRGRNRGNYATSCTILCNQKKHKEAGANKKRQGTGIKGNGRGEVKTPCPPPLPPLSRPQLDNLHKMEEVA